MANVVLALRPVWKQAFFQGSTEPLRWSGRCDERAKGKAFLNLSIPPSKDADERDAAPHAPHLSAGVLVSVFFVYESLKIVYHNLFFEGEKGLPGVWGGCLMHRVPHRHCTPRV